jgi:glutathione peroxidase
LCASFIKIPGRKIPGLQVANSEHRGTDRQAFCRAHVDNRSRPADYFAMKTPVTLALCMFMTTSMLQAASFHDIKVKDIDGKDTSLKEYRGKVLLIVNVASKCGLTPQYEKLELLHQKYKDKGFAVLGFPCNQFGGQEPGTNEDIKQFCSKTYGVSFPMFDKIDVNGAKRHPLYAALAGEQSPFPGDIKWNFAKFLVGRDGRILERFEPKTKPDSPEITRAIESALARK